jgi:hypothetical protein
MPQINNISKLHGLFAGLGTSDILSILPSEC